MWQKAARCCRIRTTVFRRATYLLRSLSFIIPPHSNDYYANRNQNFVTVSRSDKPFCKIAERDAVLQIIKGLVGPL